MSSENPPPPPPNYGPPGAGGYGPPGGGGYGPPGGGDYGPPPPPPYGGVPGGYGPPPGQNQKVLIAFITSILGILLCWCCFGIFALAGGGTAVYLGMQAEREGAPNANIAKILGYVALGFGVVGLIVSVLNGATTISRLRNL